MCTARRRLQSIPGHNHSLGAAALEALSMNPSGEQARRMHTIRWIIKENRIEKGFHDRPIGDF
jgi:hypothetical protein